MKLTLIITTYNWPQALFLVINSIRNQSILPDEIIVADDGSDNRTANLIKDFNLKYNLNIIHSWQPDIGFRAAQSRNKAILRSNGDYIVLIDGDTILHQEFIKDHKSSMEPGYFVQGSRVLMSQKITRQALNNKKYNPSIFAKGIKNRKNSIHSNLLAKIFERKSVSSNGIKSCNMSFYKNDCMKINGFNNDFEGWGREDSDFVVRLFNSGIKRKNIHFNAIQFHLWHKENPRKSLKKNDVILNEAIKNHQKWCENGINSLISNES